MAKTKKTPCKYGSKCYRKNKQHVSEFSHPDDTSGEESEPPQKKKKKIEDYFGGEKNPKNEAEESSSKCAEETTTEEETSKDEKDQSDAESEGEIPESPKDVKENIKSKFLVEMPDDFYDFWDFAKSLNSKHPEDAFRSSLGLELVGPYDVLANKCVKKNSKGKRPCYLRHWRYYYDPPEFLTVVKGDDQTQFHIGYFRDDPKEMPSFVGSNAAKTNGTISARGENLFSAINWFIEDAMKKDKTMKKKLESLQDKLKKEAKSKSYSLELKTKDMKARDKKSVCKTFHGAGLVVPVDDNGVGYREVPETPKSNFSGVTRKVVDKAIMCTNFSHPGDLKKMFKAVVEAKSDSERDQAMDPLMEVLMLIQFANDECDYGEGLEMGLCMFSYGGEALHGQIMNLLPLGYQLTRRNEYAEIITEHLKDRKRTANLSQLI